MEKFFTPNKFFLFFCVIFVLVWLGLQMVSHMHLTNQAKIDGEHIFNWSWPSKNIRSIAEIYDTKIVSHHSNDAVVKVLAKGKIDSLHSDKSNRITSNNATSSALLTYYRMNNRWFLGKVEFE